MRQGATERHQGLLYVELADDGCAHKADKQRRRGLNQEWGSSWMMRQCRVIQLYGSEQLRSGERGEHIILRKESEGKRK